MRKRRERGYTARERERKGETKAGCVEKINEQKSISFLLCKVEVNFLGYPSVLLSPTLRLKNRGSGKKVSLTGFETESQKNLLFKKGCHHPGGSFIY